MKFLLAHAGEVHETATESAAHSFLTEWYIIPLFIIFLFGIGAIAYMVSRRSRRVTFGVVMLALLITGIMGYQFSPVLSVICLTVGFAATLLQVMLGLSSDTKE